MSSIEGQSLTGLCSPDTWNGNTLLVKAMVDLFYADEYDNPEDVAKAKAICADCPVSRRCLEDNIHEQYGIWGGKTESERLALRRLL